MSKGGDLPQRRHRSREEAIDAAAAIYLAAKIRIETERAIAEHERHEADAPVPTAWMTESEVSDYLKISVNTLRDWRRKDAVKVLPFHTIGRLVRYERSEIDAAMRAGLVDPSPDRHT